MPFLSKIVRLFLMNFIAVICELCQILREYIFEAVISQDFWWKNVLFYKLFPISKHFAKHRFYEKMP